LKAILEELHQNREVAASGASIVPLIREFIHVHVTETRRDAARLLSRGAVVEPARENERWDIAPDGLVLRGVGKTRLPDRAVVQLIAAKGRVGKGVRRIARRAKSGAVYVVAIHEVNENLLVGCSGVVVVAGENFRGSYSVAAPKLIHEERKACEPARAAEYVVADRAD